MATILIIGASKGLGRAFVEGLGSPGDSIIGVSRSTPTPLPIRDDVVVDWIQADFEDPVEATAAVLKELGGRPVDVAIYNLGVWEERAFEPDYDFLKCTTAEIQRLITVNVTGMITFSQAILPHLLQSAQPRLILTGSTSALRQSGQCEVGFGASKSAVNGIADALREGFRDRRLAVTALHLGYLNTDDPLSVDRYKAAEAGAGRQIPVHDVVELVNALLRLSPSSFVRELVMPATLDQRF